MKPDPGFLTRSSRHGKSALASALAGGVLSASLTLAQVITEYPVVGGNPTGIATGPDGALRFTDRRLFAIDMIGRMDTSGNVTEYPVAENALFGLMGGIVAGPDGAMWFTEGSAHKIGRIAMDGTLTEFPVLTPGPPFPGGPAGIAVGSDGNLWFAEASAGKIGRITTAGVVTEFPIPTASSFPVGIVAGPDGALWFAESGAKKIGRITTDGVITEFPASVPAFGSTYGPFAITSGPDGKLWFTGACCGFGSMTTDGVVTTYPSPFGGDNLPWIQAGPDGSLWFVVADSVGWITTAGRAFSVAVPTPPSFPYGISPGPDGAMWFGEALQVGRLSFAATSIVPASGPSAGGASVTVKGIGFQDGATVMIGGVSAGASTLSPNEIAVTTPALVPGSRNDVIVTNPDTTTATLPGEFFADFLDVPQGDPFHDFVEKVLRNGITAGCGGGDYCRDNPVTRAQMAVFLLKAEHGATYDPPNCSGIFPDVPCTPGVGFPDWIEQLAAEGITGGCGGGNYCPGNPVTRQQMAVFLLKTEHTSAYVPPACAGIFDDVACPSTFADWIEQLSAEGVTGGCQVSPPLYCPTNSVTRGQMAVFLVKTFDLP